MINVVFQQIINGLSQGATYALVALGFGMIFSVMRVMNMSHTDVFMVGAYVTYLIGLWTTKLPMNFIFQLVIMFAASIVVTGILGLIIEGSVLRPLRHRDPLVVYIATGGISIILRNLIQAIFGPDPVGIYSKMPFKIINIGTATLTLNQLLVIGTAIVLMIIANYYIQKTKWGLATRAVAEKSVISSTFGINVNSVGRKIIMISSGMAGMAGVTVGLMLGSALPTMGALFGIKSFVCMLAAGNRHIEGIIVVGFLVGVLEALVTGFISSSYRDVISLGLLLITLYFKPEGIFGSYPDSERA